MGLHCAKNFVTSNAVEAILAVPSNRRRPPIDYLTKDDFGRVPVRTVVWSLLTILLPKTGLATQCTVEGGGYFSKCACYSTPGTHGGRLGARGESYPSTVRPLHRRGISVVWAFVCSKVRTQRGTFYFPSAMAPPGTPPLLTTIFIVPLFCVWGGGREGS